MATDFTYNKSQIVSSGPFKPSGKDMPSDARTRVESYADIASIPNPHVGLKITVKVDETNDNKMTDYIVKSLKANSMGVANTAIDEVVKYVDYLGVSASGGGTGSTGDVDLTGYATETYVDNAIDTALDGHTFKFLTQAEYDALETKDPLVEYHITDAADDNNIDTSNLASGLSLSGAKLQLKNSSGALIGDPVTLPSGSTSSVDLSNYYKKSETYSKTEVDNAISEISVQGGNIELVDYVVGSSIKLDDVIINYGNIVTSVTSLAGNEATSTSFTVKLDSAPDVNQTVEVKCGDAYVTVTPSTLTFTPSNYSTPQTVTVQILENPSYVNWSSVIYVSSTDVATKSITVNATNITEPPAAITSISLDKSSLSLKEGETATIVATKTPSNTTNTYSWKSSDNSKATVVNGVVTAVSEGSCTITCYSDADESIKADCSVTITAVQIESITLQETATVSRNRTITLTPTIVPSDITTGYSWSVDNGNATVENGVVTGVTAGTSVVTCYSNKNNGIKDTCTVTINELEIESISLNQTSASIKASSTITLIPTITPSDATVPYIWETSDDSKATVENGVVTGVAGGSCTITCKSSTNNNIKATCEITVQENVIDNSDLYLTDDLLFNIDARDGSNEEQTTTLIDRTGNGHDATLSSFSYDPSITGFTENGTLLANAAGRAGYDLNTKMSVKCTEFTGTASSPAQNSNFTILYGVKNLDITSYTETNAFFVKGVVGNGYGIDLGIINGKLCYANNTITPSWTEICDAETNMFIGMQWNNDNTNINIYVNGVHKGDFALSTLHNKAYGNEIGFMTKGNNSVTKKFEFVKMLGYTRNLTDEEHLQCYNKYNSVFG